MVKKEISQPQRSSSLNFNAVEKIKTYFFTEKNNVNLQCMKFLICSVLLVCASFPPRLFSQDLITNFQPIGLFKILPQLPNADYFGWIAAFFRLFLLCAILNLYTRFSLIGASIFGLYTLIYKYNFGVIYHGNWMICAALLLLATVPARAWKPGYRGIHSTWPCRLLQIYVVLVYTSAGLQKLLNSGLQWAWSENLAVRIYSNKMTPVAEFFMNLDPTILRIVAVTVMFAEMTSFVALFSRKMAYVYMILWAMMHFGIQLTFAYHIDFLMNIACFAAFLNWEAIRTHWPLPGLSSDKAKKV